MVSDGGRQRGASEEAAVNERHVCAQMGGYSSCHIIRCPNSIKSSTSKNSGTNSEWRLVGVGADFTPDELGAWMTRKSISPSAKPLRNGGVVYRDAAASILSCLFVFHFFGHVPSLTDSTVLVAAVRQSDTT